MSDEKIVEVIAIGWLRSEEDSSPEWAAKFIKENRNETHCGDCVGLPMSCPRCTADEYLNNARAALSALEQAGYAVVKKDASREMLDAAYDQFGMDIADLELVWRVMSAAKET